MLKKIISLGSFGFISGVFIGYLISIVTSLVWGDGYYLPVMTSFAEAFKNEISAVTLQFILFGILGSAFSVGSLVWEIENWSILKQTLIHFCISSVAMLPIAYICQWMEHSISGFLSYMLIFIILYAAIWFIQYNIWKKKITEINKKLKIK